MPSAPPGDGPFQRELTVEASAPASTVVMKALASKPRLRILDLLSDRILNVSEIAEALGSPLSTVTSHVGVLEEAGLLRAEMKPGERGLQKVCQRVYDRVVLTLPGSAPRADEPVLHLTMPVGAYVDADVVPTCGLASAEGLIGLVDDPASFFEPGHADASLVWFRQGFLTYRFPNRLPPRTVPESLRFRAEICSEAPMHHEDWPSDVTVHVAGVRLGAWTSPADFGGRRGLLTPSWWDDRNSQFGLLKEWRVTGDGTWVDGVRVSDVTLSDLDLVGRSTIDVRIGVEADATHVGGLNLFGRSFGNYPEDLTLSIAYRPA
jgi:predicted transcriptional regulator